MHGNIGVLTQSKARHTQLLAQVDGLSLSSVSPRVHSVVSMGDRDLTRGRLPLGTDRWTTVVRPVETDRRALPIAAARNLAAANAIAEGADVLVFLDDVVIPGPHTLERLAEAVTGQLQPQAPVPAPVVWRAPLSDLPPLHEDELVYPLGRLHEIARPVPGAPALVPGQLQVDPHWSLFDGACFALSAEDFQRTGGFCTDYTGRGLQDADFAEVVRAAGGSLVWVGGADAYRQPAEPVDPDLQARHALRHAQVWRERWDAGPQHPWLLQLQAAGLLKATDLDGERVG